MKRSKSVDDYLQQNERWLPALNRLRALAVSSGMQETVKWGAPVYTHLGKNVVGLGAFNLYVGLWFFQGVFLKDSAKVLVNAQEGKTKAMRQWRFQSEAEIDDDLVRAYIKEAMQNQAAGKTVKPQKGKPLVIPQELQAALDMDAQLREKFRSLSLTRQREFAEHIELAKRVETKSKRMEKIKALILAGTGLNDKYK